MYKPKDRDDLTLGIIGAWRSDNKLFLFLGGNVSMWDVEEGIPIATTMEMGEYEIELADGYLRLKLTRENKHVDYYNLSLRGEDIIELEKDGEKIRFYKQIEGLLG